MKQWQQNVVLGQAGVCGEWVKNDGLGASIRHGGAGEDWKIKIY